MIVLNGYVGAAREPPLRPTTTFPEARIFREDKMKIS
jgi:hypothetical protein